MNHWMKYGHDTSAIPGWDCALTTMGASLEDAMEKIPEEFKGWRIVQVDYPIGYSRFAGWSGIGNRIVKQYTGYNSLRLVQ